MSEIWLVPSCIGIEGELSPTYGKGEDERASRADEEDNSDVEEEGGRGVDDEEGESNLVEDLVEGSGTLEEGDEERVEESADLFKEQR